MRSKLFLLVFMPLISLAQVNDMFYVPKKEVKLDDVTKILSAEDDDWGVADNGNTRDVDEYNRRVKVVPRTATAGEEEYYYEDTYPETVYIDDNDYDYYTRIVRFQNPTKIVICNPYYWDIYSPGYYYDSFWDTYWDYSWHYNGFNVNFHTGWHRPWYDYTWHTPPPLHHHHYDYGVRRTTARRIPITTSARRDNNGRVPVANKKEQPRTPVNGGRGDNQVRKERKTGAGRAVNPNRGSERKVQTERRGNNENRNVQRNSNTSTYNRRSSTSVNSSNPSRSTNRTPVSRGGVQRGGAQRGGRR